MELLCAWPPNTTFSQIAQPATHRSYHTLGQQITHNVCHSRHVLYFALGSRPPPSHFPSVIRCGFQWDVPQILTLPCIFPRNMFPDIYHRSFSPRGTSHDTCHGVSHGIRLPMGQPMEHTMWYLKIHPMGTHTIDGRGPTLVRLWSPTSHDAPHGAPILPSLQ